ncbi:MAG TPA: hypothetical protein DHV03_04215 [Alphaproteobacteria bacterium]|nr:hypothetical protein [Alphaproteobacteria bacterium]HCJ62621.1 hypothetical protein [Alphaproteobacteria bacterium]HCY47866.1 hypothetical protein [Alphaproteobacteria bacterium]
MTQGSHCQKSSWHGVHEFQILAKSCPDHPSSFPLVVAWYGQPNLGHTIVCVRDDKPDPLTSLHMVGSYHPNDNDRLVMGET